MIFDPDQEIEGGEPFLSRISTGNFGAQRHGTFAGWIRVMKPVVLLNKRESEISQHDNWMKHSFAYQHPHCLACFRGQLIFSQLICLVKLMEQRIFA